MVDKVRLVTKSLADGVITTLTSAPSFTSRRMRKIDLYAAMLPVIPINIFLPCSMLIESQNSKILFLIPALSSRVASGLRLFNHSFYPSQSKKASRNWDAENFYDRLVIFPQLKRSSSPLRK